MVLIRNYLSNFFISIWQSY